MAAGNPRARILEEVLKARHDDSFERALGRAVRHLGGDYAEYLALVAEVRECGRRHRVDLRTAARFLADQP